jgi:hypothetical protein
LNLLGQPGEQPDFVVAAWVLPYVYALRGDRDWRRSPQLTGSRQVSQLAIQAHKILEVGDATIPTLKHELGREVTEAAVLRAITELWQQLRIIPVVSAPGEAAKWQLLRLRYQKAIAEGASTSQVTAISVLASIYLQAVIAASMEEVEMFLAPLTARSKVREVLRGLVATRQVHTLSLGHAPHFYVAGTLPEFTVAPTVYASSSMSASAYFLPSYEREEEVAEPVNVSSDALVAQDPPAPRKPVEPRAPRAAARKPAASGKSSAARPHFSRPAAHSRDRKPAQTASGTRPARRTSTESRPASSRSANGARPSNGARWSPKPAAPGSNGKHNGAHAPAGSGNGGRSNGNGRTETGRTAARPSNGASGARTAKPSAPAWGKHNGHSNGAKSAGKPVAANRNGNGATRGARLEARAEARPARTSGSRKPALSAGTKASAGKRFGFAATPKRGTKKRG